MTDGPPTVSVVIPFRNRFHLVHEAVESVLRQTMHSVEVVLVDDGSEAQFASDRYADSPVPIRYVRNARNVGPAASRFAGLSKSRGNFVVFLDSDDLLAETYLEKQLATMERLDNPSFVYCFTKLFSSEGVISDRHIPQTAVNQILPHIFLNGRVWCTSACLWSRAVLKKIVPFDGYIWEDYRMDVSAALVNNSVGCTPEYLCFYRIDSGDKLSVDTEGRYAKLLHSVDGILRAIWESGKRFPEFDCTVGKLMNKYLTCLINLSDDPAFFTYCTSASRLMLIPRSLRYWFAVQRLMPRVIRLLGLRLAKKVTRRALATKCQNAT